MSSNLVVVAIPSEDDYVWNISSEKVPHITILFLGDVLKVQNLSQIAKFVEHAASISLKKFGLDVDRRGMLGEDEADVLFFTKSKWSGYEQLRDFRAALLQDNNIRTAYDSTEQFPEWQPHLTLGYPATPAKKDERDFPGIYNVFFDRIALWFGDYDGFEFPLETYDWEMDLSMSVTEEGSRAVNQLMHYGVKGMRWGHRKDRPAVDVTVTQKGKKLQAKGGENQPAHPDAIAAKKANQVAKKSGHVALSNKELEDYARRLGLEQNVKRLERDKKGGTQKFIASLLAGTAKQQATRLANDAAAKQVSELLKNK